MKRIFFLALVASSSGFWWLGNEGNQLETGGNQGGLFGGIGGILNPITDIFTQLLQQILGSVRNIVDGLGKLLGSSLSSIKGIASQLLNPILSIAQKQTLVQNALKNVEEPAKVKAQQVASALMTVSDQLKTQPIAVRQAVSDVVTLAFDEQFRQLRAQQQQDQLQAILKGLSQPEEQAVENILNTFKALIGSQ